MNGTVFMNCASYIRVREIHFLSSYHEQHLDVLDDTRVHPEDYDLARKMAADALDIEDAILEDDESPSHHVKELMEGDVEKLNYLMLDDYALQLEKQLHKPKKLCLYTIKDELMFPFRDNRRRFTPPSEEEIFFILSGESRETLSIGSVVSVIVMQVRDRILLVQLGSGLDGTIKINNIDVPYGSEDNISSLFETNQALMACIKDLNYERLSVDLSVKQTDVDQNMNRVRLDQYFDIDAQKRDHTSTKRMMQKSKVRQTRTVRHPYWQNFDSREAERFLESKPRGEIVVRPSSKGHDHISITWKVDEQIYQHIDVKEEDKPNDWSLGNRLIIENKVYTEIDQIIAEFIDPMTRRIALLHESPKYQRKSFIEMGDY
jgi:transcription elongation factor SPT6